MSVFDRFSDKLQHAIASAGISAPSEIQEKGIPPILAGENTLLIAPTGMGKTEAAILPVLQKILENNEEPIACIYITPLRALNRDLLRRIDAIASTAGITVSVRHGDTSQYERMKQAEKPAHLLITTPETLQILFLGKKLRAGLAHVKHVIVDEIHELCTSERGYQMAIALERLEHLAGHPIQRIGLSATVGKPEVVAAFLTGTERKCTIVENKIHKDVCIEVRMPERNKEVEQTAEMFGIPDESADAIALMHNLLKTHTSTLIFVNTRTASEYLGVYMQKLFPELKIAVHHGSLAKDVRIQAEDMFKSGMLNALIATSSLELGIDIGHVDFVIQYNSPRQAARLLQRVGRSGHGPGRAAIGTVVCDDPLDALEAGIIAEHAVSGSIEPTEMRENSLCALANQIIGAATADGAWNIEEFYKVVKRAAPYRSLTFEEYLTVIHQLASLHRIFEKDGNFERSRMGREYFYANISMIPDERTFRVRDLSTRNIIATLDEAFVVNNLEIGVEFAVKGTVWVVEDIGDEEISVLPSTRLGMPPVWSGEEIPVPYHIAMGVGAAIRMRRICNVLDENAQKEVQKFMEMDCVPTDRDVFVCVSGTVGVLLCPFGSKVNETLARLISAMLSAKFAQPVFFSSGPYWIVYEFPAVLSPDAIKNLMMSLPANPSAITDLLTKTANGISYFRWTFVNVAKKFGLIEKDADYRQINLEKFIEMHRHTCIFSEAIARTIFEHMDVENTAVVLQKIISGDIAVHCVNGVKGLAESAAQNILGHTKPELITPSLIQTVKNRLYDTKVVLVCMHCGTSLTYRVREVKNLSCLVCNGLMIACVRPGEKSILDACKKFFGAKKNINALTKSEKKNIEKALLCANLVRSRGKYALLALAGRGIGPDTAARILGLHYESEDELVREIIKAEIHYTQTRKFWH